MEEQPAVNLEYYSTLMRRIIANTLETEKQEGIHVRETAPRFTVVMTAMFLAWLLLNSTPILSEEIQDVTFSTPYKSGKPTTADFYYNSRAIGSGREGFAEIVQRIDKLPPGTSVVWGPDYSRCGACSGMEPACVPEFLYPDLWKRLETSVMKHHLFLSSMFPGPFCRFSNFNIPGMMPVPLSVDDPKTQQRFDVILDWEIREIHRAGNSHSGKPAGGNAIAGRFISSGKPLVDFDLDLFWGRIPEQSHVLIRISWADKAGLPNEGDRLRALAKHIRAAWPYGVNQQLKYGKLIAVLTAPAPLAEALKAEKQVEEQRQRRIITWSNFHGPNTPSDEVLYCVNNRFVGRGDEAFQRILAQLDKLPRHTEVTIPRYQYSGRATAESCSPKERDKKNAELRSVVPFAAQRTEFDALIAKRNLTLSYFPELPPGNDSGTVIDWHSGDRVGGVFDSFGHIVRYDERQRVAMAKLGWSDYEAAGRNRQRRPECEAIYTLNDVKVGKGIAGFAKAMEEIGKLPKGSIVHVCVCLRTKGPFLCPLIYGHRHCERTGFEPYVGMFPWLINVAKKNELEIEWIPDECKSCKDCELNM
jgi:hypothetical protein